MSFKEIKRTVIAALRSGTFQHESRSDINVKNLLATGQVDASFVEKLLSNCTSNHLTTSPHHWVNGIDVHVVEKDGWYIKFYFLAPDTMFISVHQ